jgi:CO/xanthine dehydrogenase FAD-binding subunit
MGTLGGNICLENRCTYYNQSHTFQFVEPCIKRGGDRCYLIPKGKKCQAVFMADTVPALICMDAKIEIDHAEGSRQVALESLYTRNALKPTGLSDTEMVSKVIIPKTSLRRLAAFQKFSTRGGVEFGALSVALSMDTEDSGRSCVSSRIVVGSLSPAPRRALEAEAALSGKTFSEKLFKDIAAMVADEIRPILHHGYSIPFLKECLRVQTFRTLMRAVNPRA